MYQAACDRREVLLRLVWPGEHGDPGRGATGLRPFIQADADRRQRRGKDVRDGQIQGRLVQRKFHFHNWHGRGLTVNDGRKAGSGNACERVESFKSGPIR